jgi:hypothetical protein
MKRLVNAFKLFEKSASIIISELKDEPTMYAFFDSNQAWIELGLAAGWIILLVLLCILWGQLAGVKKKHKKMMAGVKVENLEELLIHMQERIGENGKSIHNHSDQICNMRELIQSMKSKLGIIRYNAFSEQGSDLSFSIALLDERKDGVVLTGLHSRDISYLYAKPVTGGASTYALSNEEKEAISRSLRG